MTQLPVPVFFSVRCAVNYGLSVKYTGILNHIMKTLQEVIAAQPPESRERITRLTKALIRRPFLYHLSDNKKRKPAENFTAENQQTTQQDQRHAITQNSTAHPQQAQSGE